MPRNPKPRKKRQDRRPRPTAASGRPRRGQPRICVFCRDHATWVDYKEVDLLRRFISDRGRIKARTTTGACAQHQRDVATAVKTARELALLPYSVRTIVVESRRARGGDRRPNGRGPTARDASAGETPTISADAGPPASEITEASSGSVATAI